MTFSPTQFKSRDLMGARNESGSTIVQGVAVSVAATGLMTLATSSGTSPNIAVDGLVDADVGDDEDGEIVVSGVTIGVCGGTVAKGDLLTPTTAGKLIKVSTSEGYIAKALSAGASGEKIPVLMTFGVYTVDTDT